MKKKTSVLVLTGAITISNIGLTTSFADVNDETLLIQEKSTIVHSQVSIETDGSARIAGQGGQLGTADDVFVRPGANGQAPHVDQFGNVTVPTGGRVELPDGNIVWDTGNDQSIVVPAGTVITSNGNGGVQGGYGQSSADQVKYAVIIVSTVPILCVYPFVQKYFEKGVMIGAVKG